MSLVFWSHEWKQNIYKTYIVFQLFKISFWIADKTIKDKNKLNEILCKYTIDIYD